MAFVSRKPLLAPYATPWKQPPYQAPWKLARYAAPWSFDTGFGDIDATSKATLAEVAQGLKSNRHARAALGISAEHLRSGYNVIESVKPSLFDDMLAGRGLLATALGLNVSAAYDEVRAQGRDLLDRTNAYAQGVYAQLPDDDQPLTANMRSQVALAINQAASDLNLLESVQSNLVQSFADDLMELIVAIATATREALDFIATAAKKIVATVVPTWMIWTLGLAGAAVVGLYVYPLIPKRRRR